VVSSSNAPNPGLLAALLEKRQDFLLFHPRQFLEEDPLHFLDLPDGHLNFQTLFGSDFLREIVSIDCHELSLRYNVNEQLIAAPQEGSLGSIRFSVQEGNFPEGIRLLAFRHRRFCLTFFLLATLPLLSLATLGLDPCYLEKWCAM
jgi:hypothetical protein